MIIGPVVPRMKAAIFWRSFAMEKPLQSAFCVRQHVYHISVSLLQYLEHISVYVCRLISVCVDRSDHRRLTL